MSTQSRIVFVRNAIGEGTAAVLARECINHLDKIAEDFKVKGERIDNFKDWLIEKYEDKIAELNKRIKGLEKLLTASVERSLVFEEANMDTSKENMLLLSRLVNKDGEIAELDKVIELMAERLTSMINVL